MGNFAIRFALIPPVFKALRGASPAFFLVGILLPLPAEADGGEHAPAAERRLELIRLVRNDCGSCHGLTLKGGLGPALLPETLAGKHAGMLTETILRGRNGTAMPPWSAFVTPDEAGWIVLQLQQGFPDAH